MADVIAYKFMNGRRQVRQFSEIAWSGLGRNKQGWTQDSGEVDLKGDVAVVEKKNHAAKVVVEGSKPVVDDGVPGIEPAEVEATTEAEPETEGKPETAKAKAKPKTKKPQTKKKQ